jgi:ATP-binding cassette, subfamily C (CFTR/MRP), member 1
MIAAAFGCLRRIEKFLSTESLDDQRVVANAPSDSSEKAVLELSDLLLGTPREVEGQSINLKAQRGSIIMILGPIGSGKSTLLKMILGEHTPRTGSVLIVSPFIGYCSQTPWLPNGSIRNAITGPAADFDEKWYQLVIGCCELSMDFSRMPLGDSTEIGSRGLILSGGQKHRIVSGISIRATCNYTN